MATDVPNEDSAIAVTAMLTKPLLFGLANALTLIKIVVNSPVATIVHSNSCIMTLLKTRLPANSARAWTIELLR